MSDAPTIPTAVTVGRVHFRARVKVSTVQGAIDRLAARYEKLHEALWALRKRRDLPPEAMKIVEEALKL